VNEAVRGMEDDATPMKAFDEERIPASLHPLQQRHGEAREELGQRQRLASLG
jgi:hypothetical protein